MATVKHAVFGFGDDGETGMLAEMRGLRREFAAFRAELNSFKNAALVLALGVPAATGAAVVLADRVLQ